MNELNEKFESKIEKVETDSNNEKDRIEILNKKYEILLNDPWKGSDEELMDYLCEYWNIECHLPKKIYGEITVKYNENTKFYMRRMQYIYNLFDEKLEYPKVNNLEYDSIDNSGIYISYEEIHHESSILASGEFKLSNLVEREKKKNPFLIKIEAGTLREKIIKENEIKYDIINGAVLIDKTIEKMYIKQNKERLNLEFADLKSNVEKIRTEKESGLSKTEEVINELAILNENKNKLTEENETLAQEFKNKNDKLNQEFERDKAKLNKEKADMSKKLEIFKSYLKNYADKLLRMDFIDEDNYNDILGIQEENSDENKYLDFSELDNDKQKAISHIQAYLFKSNNIYPRHILEDFFALLQTNDLIILAGESGSGKTNLVKSFAKAIGGVSKIIPVKPNWTSAEDLLGYYNPLEKKYLSTPFLDALLEAIQNPNVPYFICLDEMNLARVEYYFADFLSKLEERNEEIEIQLYSDDEASHVLSEFKNVISLIDDVKDKCNKNNLQSYLELLKDEEVNEKLKKVFGLADNNSLMKYHSELRRMISGIINIPSTIIIPSNIRFIGAINIDETTNYLSPKILDRAHIMKFENPVLYDRNEIENEVANIENSDLKIKMSVDDLGTRKGYPACDEKEKFCEIIIYLTKEYFYKLGIEVGYRTIRQGLNYKKILEIQKSEINVMNNFIIHKILPKLTFKGDDKVDEKSKIEILNELNTCLKKHYIKDEYKIIGVNACDELTDVIKKSNSNDGIINYWT